MSTMFRTLREVSSGDVVSSSSIILKAVFGGFFFLGGCFFLLIFGFAPAIVDSWTVGIGAKLIFGVMPTLLGVALIVWSFMSLRKLRASLLEKKVLRIAGSQSGILTAARLAVEAKIPVSRATEVLRNMQSRGLAEVSANQDGAVCYKFYDLMGSTV